jgi:hypothetical protein
VTMKNMLKLQGGIKWLGITRWTLATALRSKGFFWKGPL